VRAVVFESYKKFPVLKEVDRPKPAAGEVLLKVAGAGACHSDVAVFDEYESDPTGLLTPPFILGHETAGWVEEVGPGVVGFEKGAAYLVYGPIGCGHCTSCSRGQDTYCTQPGTVGYLAAGLGRDGGMAEYMTVPARNLVPLGDADPVAAAPLADAGLTPYHAIKRAMPYLAKGGSTALVIGLGGLGMVGVQILKALTGATVIATDQKPEAMAQAEKYKEEIVSVGKWHRRIAELEKKLDQLGNINLRAGEQYKQLQERYDFLTQQMEDLVEARKTLSELLQRIDSESKERLIKTFTEVQDSFQKVFQELFEGGKAQLSFTDTDNPLEAGLEIMVQPPGKKLQNILLLSGGEKALAAIAFLFGILQVKPSPFCVLDEIDASLDDVNAVRLGNFLRRYVGQIQFLLITHRQEIIKQADILYGIAMDKHGTSQFLSLDIGDDMVG